MQILFPKAAFDKPLIVISTFLIIILAYNQIGNWQSEKSTLRNTNKILTSMLSNLEADHRSLNQIVQEVSSRLNSTRELASMLTQPSTNQSHADQLSALEANSYRYLNLFNPAPPVFDSLGDLATSNDPNLIMFISIYYDIPGLPVENTIGYNMLVGEWNQLRPDQQVRNDFNQTLLPYIEVVELKNDPEYLNLIVQTEQYLDNYEYRYLQYKNRNEHLQQMIRANIRL